MIVTSLNIENFRGIRNAWFEFHKRLNVFTGENGAGKSAILDCIAFVLSKLAHKLIFNKNSSLEFTGKDILHGEQLSTIETSVEINKNILLFCIKQYKNN